MVRRALAVGRPFDAMKRPRTRYRHGRELNVHGRVLRVVYVEDAHQITAITVMCEVQRNGNPVLWHDGTYV